MYDTLDVWVLTIYFYFLVRYMRRSRQARSSVVVE